MKWTTTSAGTVPATSEVLFRQKIEGYNINQVDYGTSNAKELTLSYMLSPLLLVIMDLLAGSTTAVVLIDIF